MSSHHHRSWGLTLLIALAAALAMPRHLTAQSSTTRPNPPTTAPAAVQRAADLYEAGLALQKQGKLDAAVEKFKQATSGDVEYAPALNHYAWFQSAFPQAQYRDGKRAVTYGLRAVAAAHAAGEVRLEADCLDTLSVAYAEAGDFEQAVANAQKALAMAIEHRWKSRIELFGQRVKLFETHQPYHDPATQP